MCYRCSSGSARLSTFNGWCACSLRITRARLSPLRFPVPRTGGRPVAPDSTPYHHYPAPDGESELRSHQKELARHGLAGFCAEHPLEGSSALHDSGSAGFYNAPVVVLDFASLYPSVFIGNNICWSTAVLPKDLEKQGGHGVDLLQVQKGRVAPMAVALQPSLPMRTPGAAPADPDDGAERTSGHSGEDSGEDSGEGSDAVPPAPGHRRRPGRRHAADRQRLQPAPYRTCPWVPSDGGRDCVRHTFVSPEQHQGPSNGCS